MFALVVGARTGYTTHGVVVHRGADGDSFCAIARAIVIATTIVITRVGWSVITWSVSRTIVVADKFLQGGVLAEFGIAPGLGVSHVEGYALHMGCYRPSVSRLCSRGLEAYGEETQIAESYGLAIEHQFLHAIEHVGQYTVDYASRVR